MWAEVMTIYRSRKYKLSFSAEMNAYLKAHQQDFLQEDTQAGMIYAYLEDYSAYINAAQLHRKLKKKERKMI